jgi:ubiquinone/menaquinone biosynthesis C-methylase UbiE
VNDVNAEAIEAWNTVLFEKFVRFRHVLVTGLGHHGTEAIARHPPRQGARVLDIGCGFGDTTLELARRVGPHGSAAGVDAAPRFVESAARDAAAAELPNARFFAADVQGDDLGGPYDRAFSRFGTMFFASAVAALRNVRRALAPDGELLMVVWRKREENPWMHLAELAVRELVPVVENEDAVTCGPGPFSMASPDLVSSQLRAAGYDRISFERFDAEICIGRTLEEALEFAMALGPAGEIMRLAGELGEAKRPEVSAALREVFAGLAREGGVYAGSSTWFVRARPA